MVSHPKRPIIFIFIGVTYKPKCTNAPWLYTIRNLYHMSSNSFGDEVCCSASKVTMLQSELQKGSGFNIQWGKREGLLPRGINQLRQSTNHSLHFALKAMKDSMCTSTRPRFIMDWNGNHLHFDYFITVNVSSPERKTTFICHQLF